MACRDRTSKFMSYRDLSFAGSRFRRRNRERNAIGGGGGGKGRSSRQPRMRPGGVGGGRGGRGDYVAVTVGEVDDDHHATDGDGPVWMEFRDHVNNCIHETDQLLDELQNAHRSQLSGFGMDVEQKAEDIAHRVTQKLQEAQHSINLVYPKNKKKEPDAPLSSEEVVGACCDVSVPPMSSMSVFECLFRNSSGHFACTPFKPQVTVWNTVPVAHRLKVFLRRRLLYGYWYLLFVHLLRPTVVQVKRNVQTELSQKLYRVTTEFRKQQKQFIRDKLVCNCAIVICISSAFAIQFFLSLSLPVQTRTDMCHSASICFLDLNLGLSRRPLSKRKASLQTTFSTPPRTLSSLQTAMTFLMRSSRAWYE